MVHWGKSVFYYEILLRYTSSLRDLKTSLPREKFQLSLILTGVSMSLVSAVTHYDPIFDATPTMGCCGAPVHICPLQGRTQWAMAVSCHILCPGTRGLTFCLPLPCFASSSHLSSPILASDAAFLFSNTCIFVMSYVHPQSIHSPNLNLVLTVCLV